LRQPEGKKSFRLAAVDCFSLSKGVPMPISGVVISSRPQDKTDVLLTLAAMSAVEVFGDDEQGHIVAVLETASSEDMQNLIDRISKDQMVLNVGLTYLNTEDEALRLPDGKDVPKPIGFRKESLS
jgi:nitrate reductase NapD